MRRSNERWATGSNFKLMQKRVWKSQVAQRIREETGALDAAEGAIKLAEELTRRCGVTYPARELARLASFVDAKIEECEMKEAGRLVPLLAGDFEFLIQVNAAHSRQRKNFSIAHEIGHILMPDYRENPIEKFDAFVMEWHDEHEEEFLCDIIAAEILLPRRQIRSRLAENGLNIEQLHDLAEEFDASIEATAVTLVRAGLGDIAVIVWEPGYNKRDAVSAQSLSLFEDEPTLATAKKKFRVKFALGHGSMSQFFFPKNKSVADDSLVVQAAHRLHHGDEPCSRGIMTLVHGRGEQEFCVQSRAYLTSSDDEWGCKIVSLVSLKEMV